MLKRHCKIQVTATGLEPTTYKSTDVKDNPEFTITEELVQLVVLKGSTTGKDILVGFLEYLPKMQQVCVSYNRLLVLL